MWYIIAYLPISNIIPIKTVVSERLLYISSIGFCLFISSVIYKIWQKKRTVTFTVFSFYIGLLSFLTFFRNAEWVDEEIFWKVNVERAPFSARAHANYASCLEGAGKLKQAQDHLEKAILYNPDQIPFKLGLAALYLNNQMIEKFDEIIKQITLTSIRKQCPRFEISYNSLLEKRHQMN